VAEKPPLLYCVVTTSIQSDWNSTRLQLIYYNNRISSLSHNFRHGIHDMWNVTMWSSHKTACGVSNCRIAKKKSLIAAPMLLDCEISSKVASTLISRYPQGGVPRTLVNHNTLWSPSYSLTWSPWWTWLTLLAIESLLREPIVFIATRYINILSK
jgi:hypothetical protein